MRLIKAALHHAGILQRIAVRSRVAGRHSRWRWRDGRWRTGVLLHAALRRRCRRGLLLGIWHRLAVSDEFCIAGGARSRRRIRRHSAGPMRPMIGDKAAAACEIKCNSEQSCHCNEPLGGHKAAGYLVRESISRSVDSIRGGTMVLKSHAL